MIDINIVRAGDAYYRFTKDDKTKSVTMETGGKLVGPWQEMPQFTAGQGKNFEGPICFRLKAVVNGQPPEWCLLLDNVSDRIGSGAFGYMPFPFPRRTILDADGAGRGRHQRAGAADLSSRSRYSR